RWKSSIALAMGSVAGTVPLMPKWWLHKRSAGEGVAIKPHYENGDVSYEVCGADREQQHRPRVSD
ncbi:hypothetical protein, partial [Citrobacter youngae]|uniref:hypothetical protein n=1 Tax=Citrobacter youngae TaxID=133448 RepID=UPI001953212D